MSGADPRAALVWALGGDALPGQGIFFNAIPGCGDPRRMFCVQPFRPSYEALEATGHSVVTEWEGDRAGAFEHALILGTKQTDETRGMLSAALEALAVGGLMVAAAAKDAGGARLEDAFSQMGLDAISAVSKHHSRVVTGRKGPHSAAPSAWRERACIQRAASGLWSCPGLFGWDKIDTGSALLAASLPTDLRGDGADFCCGSGYLAREVLRRCPAVSSLVLSDADARAVACARRNLEAEAGAVRLSFLWEDLRHGSAAGSSLDWIVLNPPFHAGKHADSALGQSIIATARRCLRVGGRLFLVANRHLPYEDLLAQSFPRVRVLADANGFKVIEGAV